MSDKCPLCNGVGFIITEQNGYIYANPCECTLKKDNLERLKLSGINPDIFNKQNFDTFKIDDAYQKDMKDKGMRFCNQEERKFFYAGGQVGCGKTHLCTAVLKNFYDKAYPFKYVVYGAVISELKALSNEYEDYTKLMSNLCEVKVLYIDDLFKGAINEGKINNADVKHVFKLINERYINQKITIISSEYWLDEVMNFDEAIGSRIKQMCGGFVCNIKREKERNQRLKVI